MARQAVFDDHGRVSDVPAKDSERPQLEAQGDLLLWEKQQDQMKALEEKGEKRG